MLHLGGIVRVPQQAGDAERNRPRVHAARRQRGQLAADQPRVHVRGVERRMHGERMQERGVGLRPGDDRLLQRLRKAANGGSPIWPRRDQLGNHGIVERRNLRARLHAGIDPQPLQLRRLEHSDRPGRRNEPLGRILRTQPRFDGVTGEFDLVLRQRQRFSRSDAQLPLHQIEARDQLRHRMLDLQARVHLDEVPGRRRRQIAALHQELDRARPLVADRLGAGDSRAADLGAQLRRHAGRRRLLDHLLVAPLQRAVAFE